MLICANWFDGESRQTKYSSLRTSDTETAKERLAIFVVKNAEIKKENPNAVLLSTIFARHYDGYAKAIASADVTLRALNKWLDFYGDITVADLTVEKQEAFIADLRAKKLSDSYIRRTISAGKAALNYAYKRQEITTVPHIFTPPDGAPKERVLKPSEMAALSNAVEPGDKNFMFLIVASNTLARPGVCLDLSPAQIDMENRLVNLLPPGQTQTKKRRPILPLTNTLLPWVKTRSCETFINYHGKRIANNKKAFASIVRESGINRADVERKTIRHTMATAIRKHGADVWEVESWLGHKMPSTSERYAKFSPDYLSVGRITIDNYFEELQRMVSYDLRDSCVIK